MEIATKAAAVTMADLSAPLNLRQFSFLAYVLVSNGKPWRPISSFDKEIVDWAVTNNLVESNPTDAETYVLTDAGRTVMASE